MPITVIPRGAGAGYKVYAALLTQSGTDAPVATVLQNTLGGAVVWSFSGSGEYVATLSGAFPPGKVPSTRQFLMYGNGDTPPASGVYRLLPNDDDTVILRTYNDFADSDSQANDLLDETFIEIRVYT